MELQEKCCRFDHLEKTQRLYMFERREKENKPLEIFGAPGLIGGLTICLMERNTKGKINIFPFRCPTSRRRWSPDQQRTIGGLNKKGKDFPLSLNAIVGRPTNNPC
jgi:hypothetical protein